MHIKTDIEKNEHKHNEIPTAWAILAGYSLLRMRADLHDSASFYQVSYLLPAFAV